MQEAQIWGEARGRKQNLILDKRREELFANLVEGKIRRKWFKLQGKRIWVTYNRHFLLKG